MRISGFVWILTIKLFDKDIIYRILSNTATFEREKSKQGRHKMMLGVICTIIKYELLVTLSSHSLHSKHIVDICLASFTSRSTAIYILTQFLKRILYLF